MPDEELQKIRSDMSSERNISAIKHSSTENSTVGHQAMTPWSIFFAVVTLFSSRLNGIEPNEAFQTRLLSNNHDNRPEIGWQTLVILILLTEEASLIWYICGDTGFDPASFMKNLGVVSIVVELLIWNFSTLLCLSDHRVPVWCYGTSP